ncbi:Pyridoxamine 5'-phosphate oxidase [Actinacidiphila alni]|uniref:Pyridoxamine 5'-phosphate oxidase n=1 Tax=Actinacidiphila alni TaxID=380248 RepID=A0A1I2LSX4_9ACTN|nr:pyridoxamine 5'-phosphate oxidase family protein [Actinacidiphila alni]SFF81738.1 Pyridoxamine 5'-phosphate oxidase [Actinacidiphila alni]
MTALEPAVSLAVDAYRTCEFVTLARDGTPLAWPTVARRREDGTFLITTSLAFAQKALNVRRDGRVALLFSDPTGSGLDTPEQVVVSGTAACPEEIVTSPRGEEAYWSALFDRQPDSRRYVDPPVRALMDWYYLRLLITVTPTDVRTRAPLSDAPTEDSHADGASADLPGAAVLADFRTAVLAARDASGAPRLVRTRTTPVPGGFGVDPGVERSIVPGPASLLVHRHDERLAGIRNALVRGELTRTPEGGWALLPERVIEPSGDGRPRDLVRTLLTCRRTAKSYLRRRNLERPRVDWPGFKALAAESAARGGRT